MKKYGPVLIGIVVMAVLIPLKAQAVVEAGKVMAVQREAYLIRDDNTKRAQPQMQLYLKDAVTTAENSRTKLYFTDDSILNVGELSRVEIREYRFNAERGRSIYKLLDGTLKVVVGRSDLQIHTPTAVAAARGTKFIIWVEGSGSSLLTVIMVTEGVVDVRNIADGIDGAVSVHKGQMSVIPVNKSPGTPFAAEVTAMERKRTETLVMGNVMREGASFSDVIVPLGMDKVRMGAAGMGMGIMDTGGMDTGDIGAGGVGDAGMGAAGMGDAGMGDAGMGDAGMGDAGMGDAGMGDTGMGDTGMGDTGMGDGQYGKGAK